MKQLLRSLAITACVAFSFAGAQAQVITAERAQEIANSFFSNGKQKSAAVRSTAAVSMKKSADSRILTSESSSDEAPTFHIITPASGEGFVIVSGEEIENPIIGYSFEGTIDTNNLPVGFVDYITDIDTQVKALRKYNANNPQKAAAARSAMQKTNYNATTMGDKVYLETASWGQEAPYNKLCFDANGNTALTGCVPTAYAILCHYHKWPVNAKEGTVTNDNTSQSIKSITLGHTYDYANMLNSYRGAYTDEQATAVATLIRDLGYAYNVVYGQESTASGSGGEGAGKLIDIFRYRSETPSSTSQTKATNRDVVANDVLWIQYIKQSLDAGLPIPYSATGDGGRHIFILDGYTQNDYFHFNWGWNGNGNGWFTLNAMTPDTESDYSVSNRAYFMLMPDKTKYAVTATASPENAGTVSINGSAAASSATGEYIEGLSVTLAATANTGYTFENWTKGGEVVSTNKSCTVKVASSDNDYVANFLTVGNTTVNVSVEYNSSYGTVTGTSGTVTNGTTLTPRLNEEVTLTATPADGYIFTGWTVTKGTESTNYSGTSLTFVATGEMSVTANFTLAIVDYIIDNTTGTTLTTDKVNEWNFKETDTHKAPLTFTSDNATFNYNNNYIQLFLNESGQATYTLGVSNDYIITGYKINYKRVSSTYNIVFNTGGDNITPESTGTITVENLNTSSTDFSLTGGANRHIQVSNIIVTIKKVGAGSTPEPEPTTYTITATANPGTAGSVTGGGTYNEGATVTLTATPNNGYEFVNWTSGTTTVSTSATYSFTANANAEYVANFEPEVQDELTTGYYHLVSRVTSSHEYLYNNALRTNNSNKYTLQSDSKITTNNGIWYITVNGDQLGVKNGDGNALVTGAENRGAATSHNTLNIEQTTIVDDVTYYSFIEGINCTNRTQYNFTLEGGSSVSNTDNNYVATWTGHPEDNANQWRLERVDTEGKNIYDVVVECTEQDVYVVYGSGTNEEYAFNGGFFITDATITAQQLTAKKNNAEVQDVTVLVDGNTIRVVDTASNEQTLNVTYSGATWNNEASSWWVSVVTNTTPAVTVRTTDGTPKIGYSTFNDVRHPYLLDGNSFTISVPANCKITGYRLGYKAHNLVSKSVTYTNGKQSTGTITIAQSDEENTLTVTGLDNNEISFSVEDQSSQAGFIIKSLEITYVENEFEPAMFKAEIEGWRDNNPNTHLGTITIGGTAMKLTPAHQTASELTMPVVEGTALAFTRQYRGFEFNGFYIGSTSLGQNPTLTAENVAAIDENNPLIAKFTTTDDVTLFYDDDEFSYRIPAIAKTGNGMLVAVSDYRHNLDDIGRDNHSTGTLRVDLVMRTSTDNGATWSETKTIAAGDNNQVGSYQRAYGDAAIAAVGQNIVVMAAAGDVVYTAGTTSSPNKMARIYSTDNGATWTIEEMTTKMYSQSTSLIPSGGSAFFGSGKLAVDPNFNGTGNARIYGALLVRIGTDGYNNFGVFSDDLGATWKILGGDNTNPVAKGDEPKVEILPNGQILLSARRGGGRVFRVFTYGDDKANGAGSWGDAAVNGCDNGGSNATNGEIICLDAKRPNGKPTKILLQSQPKGGSGQYDRKDVTIWYKEVSADETYTSATIASDWTMGKQVSTQLSAYSAMCLQANGEIALFFEEAPCYGDDYTKGYSMVYIPLTIEEITNDNFLNPNAVVETVTVDVTLTDEQGNTYTHQLDYLPGDAAAIDAALKAAYPLITELGEGNLQGSDTYYTYTNTVTLPFKVSNANTTVWHNIYWPANGSSPGQFYPIYMMANADNATNVAKITEQVHYGNSQYNTYNYADKLAWAVYNVNNSFTFKFKNKLTGKFMAVNGVVSSDNASNVIYTDENNATAFTLTKNTGTTYKGDFAITSVYNGTTGYVCNTSAGYEYATNYTGNGHHGAWAKIVESPDYWTIYEKLIADINDFGAGDGNYTENDAISSIDKDALGTMLFSDLTAQATAVQNVKDSYTEITLTVPEVNDIVPGNVKILDEDVSHKFVPKGNVTIQAMPAAGYRFVNWTRPAAAASAAARAAGARNSNVVSTDNPYTVTVSEALSLEANFEQIVVTATLTDAQGNTYIVEVDGFTEEVTKASVATKLTEKYPFIKLGDDNNSITLSGSGTAYTYTNTVVLPFKVDNSEDTYLHNTYIYWLQGNDYPVYISGLNATDMYVSKVTGDYAYGDHPTYNTYDGNSMISWTIYNVNDSFEFIFKNEKTGMYMQVTDVAATNAKNTKFVERANATTFTLVKGDGEGLYALTANIDGTPGYLCSTETAYGFTTFSNNINYAWLKFAEAEYMSRLIDLEATFFPLFDKGNGRCIVTEEIQAIKEDFSNGYGDMTLNTIISYTNTTYYAMENWPTIKLNITPENSGTTAINGEEGVTTKRAPADYQFPIAATPATGYHFVNWTGTDYESTNATTTITISGGQGVVTEFTANFAINTYTINVTAEGNGVANTNAATVEHGNSVTLTATPETNNEFTGWYNGEELVSTENPYTFTATSNINYTARFNEVATIPAVDLSGKYYRLKLKDTSVYMNISNTNENNGATSGITTAAKEINKNAQIFYFTKSNDGYKLQARTGYYIKCHAWNANANTTTAAEATELTFESTGNELEYLIKWDNTTTDNNDNERDDYFKVQTVSGSNYIFCDAAPAAAATWVLEEVTLHNVTVTAAGTAGTATVAVGGGEGTISATVEQGTSVTLTATPNSGYVFANWTNNLNTDVVTENPYTVTATADVTYTANFQEEAVTYTISVSANPVEGGIVTGGGTYDKDANATLTATPNANYDFVNWTKNGVEVSTAATMIIENITANAEYVANFNYTGSFVAITTSVETIGGGEGGTVTGGGNYANGGTVTLTATPSGTNYRFMGWYNNNDEQVSTATTFEFTATANAKYTAKFIKRVYVEIIQPDMINDLGQPDKGYGFAYTWIGSGTQYTATVDYGTEVTINVLVYDEFNSNVEFAYWSIDDEKISQENPYTFTATEDRYEFLANFNLRATLEVESDGNGSAYIGSEGTTSKEVVTGNTYTISAKAISGYAFDYWAKISGTDETKVSSSAVYTFVLTASLNETVTYKAYFKEITELEDGKAYRIKARMGIDSYRYIYRDGNQIKWKDSQDDTNNSIFIAQYDFTANDGSLNLISAVGDLGWNYEGIMGDTYVALKTTTGTVEGTFTLYNVQAVGTGSSYRSYNAYSDTEGAKSGNMGYNTRDTGVYKVVNSYGTTDFIFEEVPFEFNVNIANGSNAKLGTINLPFATTVHPSITAYAVTGSDENYAYVAPLTLEDNILPANTPVLVEAEEAGTYGFAPAPASNTVYETGFAGTLGAKEIADDVNAYILSYKGAGTTIKLYKLANDDRTINANKAYYIDETGSSSAISFKFVGTTYIDGVESEDENAKGIYDLQGRKLSEITEPGIYIVDGKKIIVK